MDMQAGLTHSSTNRVNRRIQHYITNASILSMSGTILVRAVLLSSLMRHPLSVMISRTAVAPMRMP